MTSKFVCFFLIFSYALSHAQSDFNKLDEKGMKNGVWKGYYPDSKRLRYDGNFEHG